MIYESMSSVIYSMFMKWNKICFNQTKLLLFTKKNPTLLLFADFESVRANFLEYDLEHGHLTSSSEISAILSVDCQDSTKLFHRLDSVSMDESLTFQKS